MRKHPSLIGRARAYRSVLLQVVMAILFSVITLFIFGAWQAFLILIGAGIAVIPNFIFATFTFTPALGRGPGQLAQAFFQGVVIKLMLTILLFGLTFALLQPQGMAVFMGFIAAQLGHWLAPLLFQPKQLG